MKNRQFALGPHPRQLQFLCGQDAFQILLHKTVRPILLFACSMMAFLGCWAANLPATTKEATSQQSGHLPPPEDNSSITLLSDQMIEGIRTIHLTISQVPMEDPIIHRLKFLIPDLGSEAFDITITTPFAQYPYNAASRPAGSPDFEMNLDLTLDSRRPTIDLWLAIAPQLPSGNLREGLDPSELHLVIQQILECRWCRTMPSNLTIGPINDSMQSNNRSFLLGPNPITDFCTVNNPQQQDATLQLFDQQGNLLLVHQIAKETTDKIDLSAVAPGFYWMVLSGLSQEGRLVVIR